MPRPWTALLVLAAVFAVHGLQCTAAADGHAAHAAADLSAAAHGEVASAGLVVTAALPVSAHALAGHGVLESAPHAPPGRHPWAPPESAGHLWTLCLAVLAAGLAVLLAVVAPHLVRLASPAPASARSRSGSPPPPRPPDLSALCLLRI
ncbi:hypothetical protein ACI8AC_03595 [Geodermatophilus sp. SYSU D00758]